MISVRYSHTNCQGIWNLEFRENVCSVFSNGQILDLLQCEVFVFFLNKSIVLFLFLRPDIIDPAILRPGRLDQLIYIPLPDEPVS